VRQPEGPPLDGRFVQGHGYLVSGVGDAATGGSKLVIVLVNAMNGSTGIVRGNSPWYPDSEEVSNSLDSGVETTDVSATPSTLPRPEPKEGKCTCFMFGLY
jgi:hypothetical protein